MRRTVERSLVVILGAGASYDCHVGRFSQSPNTRWRPPLSKDLFSPYGAFQSILRRYKYSVPVAAEFNRRIAQGNPDSSVEEFLRELQGKRDKIHKRQYLHVHLYLQDLLDNVSTSFFGDKRTPTAYTSLVDQIYGSSRGRRLQRVCFVSLNYDLLLEHALETQFGSAVNTMGSYIGLHRGWSLVKFHGSVNWGRRIQGEKAGPVSSGENAFSISSALIDTDFPLLENLEDFVEVVDTSRVVHDEEPCYFPALAVPVKGKYGAVCPDEHLGQMRKALSAKSVWLLAIGFSAQDQDLLDELKGAWPRLERMDIVSGSKEAAHDVCSRLRGAGLEPRALRHLGLEGSGFADYV
ncbi:hypothetical protein ACFL2T_08145, partial [Elusimicrobiota bacterium]